MCLTIRNTRRGGASGRFGNDWDILFNRQRCKSGGQYRVCEQPLRGTYTQFNDILPDLGITTKFVDPNNPENFAAAIDENTKALFCETVSNPGGDISDLEAIAKIAHDNGMPFIVDATFSTPYLTRPIEFGADIVVHSLTKWFGGHGTGIGGVVVDSGTFNWANGKFPLYDDEPDSSYHGLRWVMTCQSLWLLWPSF